jgi:ketosteroid isomerase-like protein
MNATLARLHDVMNRHDPQGMAALFAPDYRSEQPLHPNRGFGGKAQVAKNWTAIFAAVPDLALDVVAEAVRSGPDGTTSWSEWDWRGRHPSGAAFHMRGVILLGLDEDGLIRWGRLYMDDVEEGGDDIDQATQRLTDRARDGG